MCQSNTTRDDGGWAFPMPGYTEPNGDFNWGADGMTLRDYFAAKAMQCFGHGTQGLGGIDRAEVERQFGMLADFSYLMADAMLKARRS